MKLAIRKLAMWIGAVSIAALAPLAQASISNPGFEFDFSGWTATSDANINSTESANVHSGSKSAFFGFAGPGPDSLGQSLTLNPTSTYVFGFWVKCLPQPFTTPQDCGQGGYLNLDFLSVFLGTTQLALNLDGALGTNDFQHYLTTAVTPVSASELLEFRIGPGLSDGIGGFFPLYPDQIYVDDVTFVETLACNGPGCNVPEPGSLLLVGVALTAGAIVRRRRQR